MAEAIIMPKTGMAMKEGIIIEWLVKEGDSIETGDPVAEIETDKSAMTLESDCSGTILKILYEEGTVVPVVQPIAWVGKPGEKLEDIPEETPKPDTPLPPSTPEEQAPQSAPSKPAAADAGHPSGKIKATPAARRTAQEKNIALEQVPPSGSHGEIRKNDVLNFHPQKVTPLARKMAEEKGLSLAGVQGSGIGGRIFSADLPAGSAAAGTMPLTRIQQITGLRMLQSHTEIPAVTMDIKADVTRLLAFRRELNEKMPFRVSLNDLVMKAAAAALKENPRLNSVLDGTSLILNEQINLGMAVATERGLLVPVIHNAGNMSLSALVQKTAELTEKGRAGQLSGEEMEGGTFTVSNLGKFGITSFTPIINQPQAAILGVCAAESILKKQDEAIVERMVMGLSLTFDHRIADGAEAAVFLSRIRELLENPLLILV